MDYHSNFKCKRCGYCCTLLPKLSEDDIARIEKSGFGRDYFLEIGRMGDFRIKMADNKCIFLERDGNRFKCRIYEFRPEVCRIYPSYEKGIAKCPESRKIS